MRQHRDSEVRCSVLEEREQYPIRGKRLRSRASSLASQRRGSAIIEVLVASLIVGTSLAAIVSLWYFSFSMTTQADDQGVAYSLARQTMETIKETGFYNTAEAATSSPVTHYYDANQNNKDATPTSARYKVIYTVVSDKTNAGSSPVTPANDALRTVTVTVSLRSTGKTLYQITTYLARAGI